MASRGRAAQARVQPLQCRSPRFPLLFVNPASPDFQLSFEDRSGYLFAAVVGPRDNHDISVAYWSRIAEECRRRGTRRLMVVERLGEYEGERDMERMIDALIALGLDKLKVAYVATRLESLPQMEHGEILALERGANGRVFSSEALAERWLRHGGS